MGAHAAPSALRDLPARPKQDADPGCTLPSWMLAAFLVLAFALILIPSIGMAWAPTTSTTENRDLAAAPSPTTADGALNLGILADAGAWFDDHFAYRNEMVAANARIRTALGTSPTDQVIAGDDGWLYYGGTLSDYLGTAPLTDRALRNIAHNLSLAQNYATAHGAAFAFALAPDKNALYPQAMPYYYLPADAPRDSERLAPYLAEAGVNYVDLASLFAARDDVRYLKTDSHWDNRGALIAANALLEGLDRGTVADADPEGGRYGAGEVGDLESMLYPVGAAAEANWYFEGYNDEDGGGSRWSYTEGSDVTDSWIRTKGAGADAGESSDSGEDGGAGEGAGSLLMFRDSFGNALAPFLAGSFDTAAFSKLVPYNLTGIAQVKADSVIIERAERHLAYLAQNAPLMPSPRVDLGELPDGAAEEGHVSATAAVDGPYLVLAGGIDGSEEADDLRVYVAVERPGAEVAVYDAFWISGGGDGSQEGDFGYRVNLNAETNDLDGSTVRILGLSDGKLRCLGAFDGASIGRKDVGN